MDLSRFVGFFHCVGDRHLSGRLHCIIKSYVIVFIVLEKTWVSGNVYGFRVLEGEFIFGSDSSRCKRGRLTAHSRLGKYKINGGRGRFRK